MSNDFRGNRSEINRLNRAIAAEEQTINSIFQRMGQIYFTSHREDAEESQVENIRGVQAALERARGYQEQINVLKGIALCPSCKAEVSINAAFCSRCGTRMPMKTPPAPPAANALVCPGCGTPCTAEMRFCNRCGTKLEKAPAAPAAPEAPAAPVMQPPSPSFVPTSPSETPPEPAEIPSVFSPIPQPIPQPVPQPIPQPVPQPVPPIEAASPAPPQAFTDFPSPAPETETVAVSDDEQSVNPEPDLPETEKETIEEAMEAAAEALAAVAEEASPAPAPAEERPAVEAAAVKRFCANCGTPIREGYRFCLNCGSPV